MQIYQIIAVGVVISVLVFSFLKRSAILAFLKTRVLLIASVLLLGMVVYLVYTNYVYLGFQKKDYTYTLAACQTDNATLQAEVVSYKELRDSDNADVLK